jgi:hypothetical protein
MQWELHGKYLPKTSNYLIRGIFTKKCIDSQLLAVLVVTPKVSSVNKGSIHETVGT